MSSLLLKVSDRETDFGDKGDLIALLILISYVEMEY